MSFYKSIDSEGHTVELNLFKKKATFLRKLYLVSDVQTLVLKMGG